MRAQSNQPSGGPHAGSQPSDHVRRADAAGIAESPDPVPPDAPPPETVERQAAWRRVEAARRGAGAQPPRTPYGGIAHPEVARHAFAVLAENVRDYAIFLMDPDGVITFWGEGARLRSGGRAKKPKARTCA